MRSGVVFYLYMALIINKLLTFFTKDIKIMIEHLSF